MIAVVTFAIAMISSAVGSSRRIPTWLIWLMVVINISINNLAPDPWGLYHYYLNSKYFSELGYFQLYECTVELLPESITRRNLHTYEWIPAEIQPDCRATFDQARWQSFSDDFNSIEAFNRVGLLDKGLNALPAWVAIGSFVANNLSVVAVTLIDPLLLLLAVITVIRYEGYRRAGLAVLFIVTFYGTYDRVFGHFGQWAWLSLSLMGVTLAHSNKSRLGGLLIGLSAGLRIFPVFLLIRRDARTVLWGLLGIAITLAVGLTLPDGTYAAFIEKMATQSAHITYEPLNLGLRQTLTMAANPYDAVNHILFMRGDMDHAFDYDNPVSTALIIVLGVIVSGSSLGLMFALLTLSRYYYTILAVTAVDSERTIQHALLTNAAFMLIWLYAGEAVAFTYGQIVWIVFFASLNPIVRMSWDYRKQWRLYQSLRSMSYGLR